MTPQPTDPLSRPLVTDVLDAGADGEPPVDCMPAELLANPLFLLGRLGVAIKARAVEEFDRTGFGPYHYSVLALLGEGARATQASIADTLELDRGTLVGLLDHLEQRGLVERERDRSDRRRFLVRITPAGSRQLAAFRTIIAELEEEFLAPLSAADRAALLDQLARIAAHHDPRFARTRV
jgi:MarR family transcriptional regulator, lower aerobic nicotinate degradation pathway regulator